MIFGKRQLLTNYFVLMLFFTENRIIVFRFFSSLPFTTPDSSQILPILLLFLLCISSVWDCLFSCEYNILFRDLFTESWIGKKVFI